MRVHEVQLADAPRCPAAEVLNSVKHTLGMHWIDLVSRLRALESAIAEPCGKTGNRSLPVRNETGNLVRGVSSDSDRDPGSPILSTLRDSLGEHCPDGRVTSARPAAQAGDGQSLPGELWAVKDVNLTSGPAKSSAVGGNGAGKSTLLKLMSRIKSE